jgi:ribosome biogenesis GTPase A
MSAEARKIEIRGVYDRLASVAAGLGLSAVEREIRGDRLAKLDEERLSVVLVGEFNRGKSTLVNALLADGDGPRLPVGITPTTAVLTLVRRGDVSGAEVVRQSGRREPIDPARLAERLTVEGAATDTQAGDPIEHVEVRAPSTWLDPHVTLVDTPGVNDLAEQRADITYGYLPRADAVLFLLDATQILSASERRFLEERVLRACRDRLIFVVTKADLLSPDELREAVAFARQHLQPIASEAPLFTVAAKRALAKTTNGVAPDAPAPQAATSGDPAAVAAGLPALREHLTRTLGAERRRLVLDNALADAGRLTGFLRQSVAIRRRALELPLDELAARVQQAEARLSTGRRALGDAATAARTEAAGLKARVRQDVVAFKERLLAELPAGLDAVEPADIQAHLGAFLQDVWRRFLEAEGALVAAELERIAEAALAVANDSAAGLGQQVAAELDLPAGRFELDVSTFRYDATVFALGALGTTIFLFVNALVGGLLTLAAPIAAVLLRGRAAQEIRDEAKRRAPEAVAAIAARVGPRLDQAIDDFVGRLEEFLTEAAAALARGLGEVLTSALEARRRVGAEAAQGLAELDAAAATLKDADEAVAELRQGVWQDGAWASSTA